MNGRYLNEVAQGIHSIAEAKDAFEKLSASERTKISSLLAFMAGQASATREDVRSAITSAGLGTNFQPVWEPIPGTILPLKENSTDPQQFDFLLALFSIADARRRGACAGDCSHWWHHLNKVNTND